MTPKRRLGRDGPEVSAIGLGCWTIGGLVARERGRMHGWYGADDAESIRAIHRALDLGVTFLDTADIYGIGHSERLLGEALKRKRDGVVLATKFGKTFDEERGIRTDHHDERPEYIRAACEASLRRLATDRIDLYQLHDARMDLGLVDGVLETLEGLVAAGKIRGYGWSTDDPERAGWWADRDGCAAVQHHFNVLEDNPEMIALCERAGLASINRGPLAMGLLSGKFDANSQLPSDDVRGSGVGWLTAFDSDGRPQRDFLDRLAAIREALTADGRTLVQGALGWIWARSERTLPIPGFKTVAQVEDNAGALAHGPLPEERMREIDALLS
jgi:aryl-alcohol dehydrogenase-like predicted oxidoreductase